MTKRLKLIQFLLKFLELLKSFAKDFKWGGAEPHIPQKGDYYGGN